ncbi:MAG TPA: hypothetical protein DEP38_19585 [Cyanobacteria bacterium UBA9226]|nr:hypothetical protein [Cyanobacteria bacterium UBA11166]HBS68087.1 hypothetical protein [Cyanobacteria bacterium UBA11153]HCA96741.1 hypothetical protein [Cyanobacteria bacterium UBA9226]
MLINGQIKQDNLDNPSSLIKIDSFVTQDTSPTSDLTQFHGHFDGKMDMYGDPEQVTAYLHTHQKWFCDCSHPMKTEAISTNSYAIVIGRFGSFGYEVEPKIGLELLPEADGIYRIQTIPVPGYIPSGYDVDFQASQWLIPVNTSAYLTEQKLALPQLPQTITRIEWVLDLKVGIRFPKFIQKLPQSLIQTTGDRVLHQIVRQVSRRLTAKVQENFHTTHGLPIPKKVKG